MSVEPRHHIRRPVTGAIAGAVCLVLFSGAAEGPTSLPTATEAGWNGQKVCEILYRDPSIRLARCSFAPGVGHERHWHPPHIGYALTAARMRVEGADGVQTQDIPAGASWSRTEVITHQALNVGDTTARYIIAEPSGARIPPTPAAAQSAGSVPDAIAAGWQGRPVCELLQENYTYRMLRCTYPPGVGQDRHRHGHYVGYVTEGGAMQVESPDGTAVQQLKTGDIYSSDGVAWHSALNVGDREFQTVIFEEKE